MLITVIESPTSSTALPSTIVSALSTSSNVPVLSVESGGVLTTITPTGTSLSPSATGVTNSTFGPNSTVPAPPACIAADYALNGALAPFCEPKNGSAWIKNNTYPITWNPNFWPGYQGKVVIALLYTGQDGSNVITQVGSPFQLALCRRTITLKIKASTVSASMTIGSMGIKSSLHVYSLHQMRLLQTMVAHITVRSLSYKVFSYLCSFFSSLSIRHSVRYSSPDVQQQKSCSGYCCSGICRRIPNLPLWCMLLHTQAASTSRRAQNR